jgi:hypothetical protein
MNTLWSRISKLENKPRMQRPDEEDERYELALGALFNEDRTLFDAYFDMCELSEHRDRELAALSATPEQKAALSRLKELEALPIEELKGMVA